MTVFENQLIKQLVEMNSNLKRLNNILKPTKDLDLYLKGESNEKEPYDQTEDVRNRVDINRGNR